MSHGFKAANVCLWVLVVAFCFINEVNGNQKVMQLVIDSRERYSVSAARRSEDFDGPLFPPSVLNDPQSCTDGVVTLDDEDFPCEEVDFYSFLSLEDLDIKFPAHDYGLAAADIWGWLSPSGKEVTLLSLDNGVVAIDSTNPANPCVLAGYPTTRLVDIWADGKVHNNTLYHVKDSRRAETAASNTTGIEVYDLLHLNSLDCHAENYLVPNFSPDYVAPEFARAHNVVVNTESEMLYIVGSAYCNGGGLLMYSLKQDRLKPELVGCAGEDGYTHDAQCVNYYGPDENYQGSEICFAFNEDTLTIYDVTDKDVPVVVSTAAYMNQAYTHQGWVTDDLTKILLDDELDEYCNNEEEPSSTCLSLVQGNLSGTKNTTTYFWNIEDLENPTLLTAYQHRDYSIDHNLYVWGSIHKRGWGGNGAMKNHPDPNFAYLNNYMAGLRVLDIHSEDTDEWFEAGFFDVSAGGPRIEFLGAWSGYMHPSGVYAMSVIERGLFLLQPRMVFTSEFPAKESSTSIVPYNSKVVLLVVGVVLGPIAIGLGMYRVLR